MQVIQHISRFCIAFACFAAGTVQAMDLAITGDIAIVSGGTDYPDIRRLNDAVAKGVTTFVLRDIGGGEIGINQSIAMHLESLKVTTVIDGVCAGACAYLLLAGKERRYTHPASGQGPVMMARSAVYSGGFFFGAASIPDVYVQFRAKLTDVIPNDLLRKQTNGNLENGSLLFFAPGPGNTASSYVLDCEDMKNMRNTCKKVPNADLLNTGVLTSLEPLVLPPALVKP